MFCNLSTDSFSEKNDLEPSCCSVYVYPAVEKTASGFSLLMVKWGRKQTAFTGLCVEVNPVKK